MGLALSSHPSADVPKAATDYATTIALLPRAGIAHVKAAVDEPGLDRSLRLAGLGQASCIRQTPLPD
jgi:hypothetical protein